MQGMKIFCSLVILISAIGIMLAAVETTSHAEYGSLTVAAAVVFSGGLVGRCILEVRGRGPNDA